MKNNTFLIVPAIKSKLFLFCFLLTAFIGQAQQIVGNKIYCIASSPIYRVEGLVPGTFNSIVWSSNDSGIQFVTGDPSPTVLYKVVIKPGNIIYSSSIIKATITYNNGSIQELTFSFDNPLPAPSYSVAKVSDYCTPQYHIITLAVATNMTTNPEAAFTISPTTPDASVIITQTSKNIFEIKLPLNGQNYFTYNVSASNGCLSNSFTSYGNYVPLNLTNCINNNPPPTTYYDFVLSPNPYSNGNIIINAPAITNNNAICKVYNSSGLLKATFSLLNSTTVFPLKNVVGTALAPGNYIVQITYSNGVVKTKNLIVL